MRVRPRSECSTNCILLDNWRWCTEVWYKGRENGACKAETTVEKKKMVGWGAEDFVEEFSSFSFLFRRNWGVLLGVWVNAKLSMW